MDNQTNNPNIFSVLNRLIDLIELLIINLFGKPGKLFLNKAKIGFKAFVVIVLISVFGAVMEWMNPNGDMTVFFAVVFIGSIVSYIFHKVSPALGVLMVILSIFSLFFIGMPGTYDTVMSKKHKADNDSFKEYETGEGIITNIQDKHKDNEKYREKKVATKLSRGITGNIDGAFEIYAENKKEKKMIEYKRDSIDRIFDKQDEERRQWMKPEEKIETGRKSTEVQQSNTPVVKFFSPSGTTETVSFNKNGPSVPTTRIYLVPGQVIRLRSTADCFAGGSKYHIPANQWVQCPVLVEGHLDIEGAGKKGTLTIEVL